MADNYTDKQLIDSIARADPTDNHHLAHGQMIYLLLVPEQRQPINAAIRSLTANVPKAGPIIALEVLSAIAELCEKEAW